MLAASAGSRLYPYDLRHTSASLMIAAGRPIAEVADHLGRVDLCARTYAHTIEVLKGQPVVPVDEAIRAARAEVFGTAQRARGVR
jgi:integrase